MNPSDPSNGPIPTPRDFPGTDATGLGTPAAGGASPATRRSEGPPRTLGPYEILSEIGRGGMGVVYKAFHTGLKRTVALKVLIAGEDASEEAIARFHREAESVAKLGHHPNIVPIYDIGQVVRETSVGATHASPLHYFAMHYVEGKPLDRMIDEGAIAPAAAALIARKLAGALQHAHDHGILHRDVKPANILMAMTEGAKGRGGEGETRGQGEKATGRPGGAAEEDARSPSLPLAHSPPRTGFADAEPMLTDFGLARDAESGSRLTRSGAALGTPNYMPPEQAGGRQSEVDARSDVYSLGATLYEMLTLSPPFEGASVMEVIRKVLLTDPASPRRKNPLVDRDLETICLKCLEKERERRYGSAAALADDLDRYLGGRPILARPSGTFGRLLKRARRNKAFAAALLALAAVLAAGAAAAILAVSGWRERSRSYEDALRSKERGKTEAEEKERTAVRVLEKSRLASSVLRAADAELGPVQRSLKTGCYRRVSDEERARNRRDAWARIESFASGVADDPTSRATWSAARGWLTCLDGRHEEGRALFEKARREDPDVAYGFLFEAMWNLAAYLKGHPWPQVCLDSLGATIVEPHSESDEMRKSRIAFEDLVDGASKAEVWGEASAREFREILRALRELEVRDAAAAERGLSKALAAPELAFLREEILLARARIRFFGSRFAEGLEDLDPLLAWMPRSGDFLNLRGCLLNGLGVRRTVEGQDPREVFRDAVATLEAASRENPAAWPILVNLAAARLNSGTAVESRGEDPRPVLRAAVEDASTAAGLNPASSSALQVRAGARVELAASMAARGEEPEPLFREALEDAAGALRRNPSNVSALLVRARAHAGLAARKAGRGEDPAEDTRGALEALEELLRRRPGFVVALLNRSELLASMGEYAGGRPAEAEALFRRAIADAGEVLRTNPDFAPAFMNRASAWGRLGEAAAARGEDPEELYRLALSDCEEAVRRNPAFAPARHNRGLAFRALGRALDGKGKDPREMFRAAVKDLEAACRLDPGSAAGAADLAGFYVDLGDAFRDRGGEDPAEWFRKGVEAAEAALKINPGLPSAHNCLGLAREGVVIQTPGAGSDPRMAWRPVLDAYADAVARNPRYVPGYANRGRAALALAGILAAKGADPREELARSIADLEKALALDPGRRTALVNLAKALSSMGDAQAAGGEDPRDCLGRAVERFTQAIAGRSADASLLNGRGNARVSLADAELDAGERDAREDFRGGIRDYEELLRIFPGHEEVHSNLGNAWQSLGEAEAAEGGDPGPCREKALREFDEALAKRPDLWQAHANRGVVFLALDRFEEAEAAAKKAMELTRDRVPALRALLSKAQAMAAAPAWARGLEKARDAVGGGRYALALRLFEEAMPAAEKAGAPDDPKRRPALARSYYDRACVLAQASAGKDGPRRPPKLVPAEEAGALRSRALGSLRRAFELGYDRFDDVRKDADLEPLRALPEFQDLLKEWEGRRRGEGK